LAQTPSSSTVSPQEIRSLRRLRSLVSPNAQT
jgi:hypothetical protein